MARNTSRCSFLFFWFFIIIQRVPVAAINTTLSHLLFSTVARVPSSNSVPKTAHKIRGIKWYPRAENVTNAFNERLHFFRLL